VKQIVQIQAINQALRRTFGPEVAPQCFGFPDYPILAMAGESALRQCKLGFRARHLHRTACLLVEQQADLHAWHQLPTAVLKTRLLALPGVGEKIADCVLLFAYGRYEVFPIDVWVERVLKQLYFPRARNRSPARLRQFALDYFGPYRGYAQQYLFHWYRTKQ
jgi:N-glycosylase/DNA lyase